MTKRQFLFFILFSLVFQLCYSQKSTVISKQLNWRYERTQLKEGTRPISIITSDEASLTNQALPIIFLQQPINGKENIVATLVNVKTQIVDATLLDPQVQMQLTSAFSIKTTTAILNKKAIATFGIIGLRINDNKEIEALSSFNLEITSTTALNKTIGSTQFKSSSILSQGDIHKLAIANTGFYKIDYTFIKNLGYDMASLDPRKIHIYSKGGGMLPRANSTYREDDLPENEIYVNGENDGHFDAADYVVFYGTAQTVWRNASGKYTHISNYYDETTYYFLRVDANPGLRVAFKADPTGLPNKSVTSGDAYFVHELNKVNDYQSGAELLGESFGKNTTQNFSFNIPDLDITQDVQFRSIEVAHSVASNTYFSISNNGFPIITRLCNSIEESFDKPYYSENDTKEANFKVNSGNFNITYTFNKNGNNDARGWLDFFEIVARKNLSLTGGQQSFRDIKSVGVGNIVKFIVNTAQNPNIWDVTNPIHPSQVHTNFTGSSSEFIGAADSLREYAAFIDAPNNFFIPVSKGKVTNQNLHATPFFDLLIVAYPDFLSEANRLANHRRTHDGLRVFVTTPQQIYNEFSGGAQDITAIREFLRMMYNKANSPADEPKYLLLFGDASFNYKEDRVFVEADNRYYNNTNYVPTFESDNYYDTDSYASDDYFGLLDDDEGLWLPGSFEAMDIGIGRLPVGTLEQASQMVDKILRYESPEALGDWRNSLMFIADDQDYNSHLKESEIVSNIVSNDHKEFNINKIYIDAYKQISLGSGYSFPDATDAVNRGMQKGNLIFNYTGHGSSIQLAHESLLTASRDIVNWKNKYQMPLFFTATCEFTEFDHIAKVSAGEDVILNPNGGGIALLTTTRVAYSNVNSDLNINFNSKNACEKSALGGSCIGDIMKLTKNKNGVNSNPSAKHFILLGDPSMRLAVPKYIVNTSKINGHAISIAYDTLRALQKVTIEGYVSNLTGDTLTQFNGEVSVTLYDKPASYVTLANDADSYKQSFSMQKNFIFKGISAVVNGKFKIDLVIPKDIAYNFGQGKISYYAYDKINNVDGSGSYAGIIIGGSDNTAGSDNVGPQILLFINDTTFMDGGSTHQNPLLYAKIFDENGINTSGVSIGHEMTAILDGNTSQPSILNDFYQGTLNNFQNGTISFPYYNLSLGNHAIDVKVWDIYNNSGTARINFIVVDKQALNISKLMSYPNPYLPERGDAIFSFEHNKAGESLNVTIDVTDSYGQKVISLNMAESNGSARFDELRWNGENEHGGSMASGVYFFKATVKDKYGNTVSQTSKLVILR